MTQILFFFFNFSHERTLVIVRGYDKIIRSNFINRLRETKQDVERLLRRCVRFWNASLASLEGAALALPRLCLRCCHRFYRELYRGRLITPLPTPINHATFVRNRICRNSLDASAKLRGGKPAGYRQAELPLGSESRLIHRSS